jgi:hypothetical protein
MSTPRGRSATALLAIGGSSGAFSGLVGGGGGAVLIPMLTGPVRLDQHSAHGTSLVVIACAAVAGATGYSLQGHVDWVVLCLLLSGGGVGAYAGARLAHRVPALRLRQALAVFLALVAIRLALFNAGGASEPAAGAELVLGSLLGLAGGLASGALGVGGGAIFVPGMVIVLGLDQHVAQGTSLYAIAPTAAIGALTHSRQGAVAGPVAAWVSAAAIPAGLAGAALAGRLPDDVLRAILAAVLMGVALQMFITASRRLRGAGTPSSAAGRRTR